MQNIRFTTGVSNYLADIIPNLCWGPYSASTALTMAWSGAGPNSLTEQQLGGILGIAGRNPEEVIQDLAYTQNVLQNAEGCTLDTACRLFVNQESETLQSFLSLMTLLGGIQEVNFGQPEEARGIINTWTKQQTHEKIKQIIPKGVLDALVELVLTNAIYLKAPFLEVFNAEKTKKANFYAKDKNMPAFMMDQTEMFPYAEQDGWQIVSLPLGTDRRDLHLSLFLPENDIRPFTENQLTQILNKMQPEAVRILMPKFRFGSSIDLKAILKALEITAPFLSPSVKNGADFSRMSFAKLFISNIFHRTWGEVVEVGVEAAAATAVVMSREAFHKAVEPNVTVEACHPFNFAIHHGKKILFWGRVDTTEILKEWEPESPPLIEIIEFKPATSGKVSFEDFVVNYGDEVLE